jgi:hypothetical protein
MNEHLFLLIMMIRKSETISISYKRKWAFKNKKPKTNVKLLWWSWLEQKMTGRCWKRWWEKRWKGHRRGWVGELGRKSRDSVSNQVSKRQKKRLGTGVGWDRKRWEESLKEVEGRFLFGCRSCSFVVALFSRTVQVDRQYRTTSFQSLRSKVIRASNLITQQMYQTTCVCVCDNQEKKGAVKVIERGCRTTINERWSTGQFDCIYRGHGQTNVEQGHSDVTFSSMKSAECSHLSAHQMWMLSHEMAEKVLHSNGHLETAFRIKPRLICHGFHPRSVEFIQDKRTISKKRASSRFQFLLIRNGWNNS